MSDGNNEKTLTVSRKLAKTLAVKAITSLTPSKQEKQRQFHVASANNFSQ